MQHESQNFPLAMAMEMDGDAVEVKFTYCSLFVEYVKYVKNWQFTGKPQSQNSYATRRHQPPSSSLHLSRHRNVIPVVQDSGRYDIAYTLYHAAENSSRDRLSSPALTVIDIAMSCSAQAG